MSNRRDFLLQTVAASGALALVAARVASAADATPSAEGYGIWAEVMKRFQRSG